MGGCVTEDVHAVMQGTMGKSMAGGVCANWGRARMIDGDGLCALGEVANCLFISGKKIYYTPTMEMGLRDHQISKKVFPEVVTGEALTLFLVTLMSHYVTSDQFKVK